MATFKKQRAKIARELRALGVSWPNSHRIAKAWTDHWDGGVLWDLALLGLLTTKCVTPDPKDDDTWYTDFFVCGVNIDTVTL